MNLSKWQEEVLYDAMYSGGNPPLPDSGHDYNLRSFYTNKKIFFEFDNFYDFSNHITKLVESGLIQVKLDRLIIPNLVAYNAIEKILKKRKKFEKRKVLLKDIWKKGYTYFLPAIGILVSSTIGALLELRYSPDPIPAIKEMSEELKGIKAELSLKVQTDSKIDQLDSRIKFLEKTKSKQ